MVETVITGRNVEGQYGQLQLPCHAGEAERLLKLWTDNPDAWREWAVKHGANPDARLGDYEWTFREVWSSPHQVLIG